MWRGQHDNIYFRWSQKPKIHPCSEFGSCFVREREALLCGNNDSCREEDIVRIGRHVADREGMDFETIECGRDILSCLDAPDKRGTFLLDSATTLLLNELFPDPMSNKMDKCGAHRCADELERFLKLVGNGAIVSDYIYSDAARYDETTEIYRRGLAEIDRRLASVCNTVLEVSCGNVIVHKGEMP